MSSVKYNTIFKLETMTTLDNQLLEKIKNHNIMYSLALLFSMLLTFNATANTNKTTDTFLEGKTVNFEECTLNRILFANNENVTTYNLDMSSIEVVEIEEEVIINFNTKNYLPEGFNALKGKDDLDFSTIEIIEIEEEVVLDFDTKHYLPKGFNALKGKDDLDWSKIEIIEIEEDLELNSHSKFVCTL